MKRLFLSLALLYSLSVSAGIPYLIQPTNAPGLVGQQLFSVGNGYSWWDWSTNAASSNSTVVSASTSVGVTTNGFNFTPFLTAGVTNWVNGQDTTVSNGVYGLFNGGTNIAFGYSRTIGGLATNNDTVVSNGVFNLLNTGTNDSFSYARSVGVLATNQDLKTSNTLWLMITNVYVDVGGNGGTTNRSGQNVTFTVVPGSGGSATNAIDNNNGNGTNTTLWTKVIFTNATLQSSLVWDGTTLTQQGGTNVSTISNLLVSGWTLLQGAETNSSITGPGFVFIDANGKRSAGTFSTGLLLSGSTLTATNSGGAQTNDAILIAGDASVTIVTNTATAGKTKYTITSAGGTPTNSIYGGVFGTNIGTGQLIIDAQGNFAQYGTNPTMFQLKDTSSNVWFAATSSNTTVTVNGTMNLASAGFTNANFLNPPYMSGANITNVYASNIVSGGQLPLGTVSTGMVGIAGPFLTTNGVARSYTYNASALTNADGGGLASTNYVINLVSSLGANVYSSGVTNPIVMTNNAAGEKGYRTNIWQGQSAVPTTVTTNTINMVTATAGNYVRHYVSTNKYATIAAGPISIVAYLFRSGAAGTVQGHYEFYGVDSVSGQMTELASSAIHTISDTIPALHQFPMSLSVDYTPANPMYVAVAFYLDSVVNGQTFNFVSGSNYDAHMSFARPLSSATITMSQVSGLAAALTDTTNNAAGSTNYTITATNQTFSYLRSTVDGSTNYTKDATNTTFGYVRTINGQGTNNTTQATNDTFTYVRTIAGQGTNNTTQATNDLNTLVKNYTNRAALYVDKTNTLSTVLTTATSTNTCTLYAGGGDWLLVSATPCSITNIVGPTAGYVYSADLTISNSTAAAFTNFMIVSGLKPVGYAATNSAAVLGFNGAVVPASSELYIHIESRGVNKTNYFLAYP